MKNSGSTTMGAKGISRSMQTCESSKSSFPLFISDGKISPWPGGYLKIYIRQKVLKVGTSVSVHAMNVLVELHIALAYQPSLSVFPLDGHGKNSSATTRGYWLCNDTDCFIVSLAYFRSRIGKLRLEKNCLAYLVECVDVNA